MAAGRREFLGELLSEFVELLDGILVQAFRINNGRLNPTLKSPEILIIE